MNFKVIRRKIVEFGDVVVLCVGFVKDFLAKIAGSGKAAEMRGAELGHGVVDYKPIFAAAGKAGLQHYFAEQEGPFSRMDPLQAVRVDYDYFKTLGI